MNVSFIGAGEDSYVLCDVAGATYAVRSDDIEHLEMLTQVTRVPNAPEFVDGVTSVRGRVLPVINLRVKFGFDRKAPDLRTRLIVVRSAGRSLGLLVDEAREFANIPEDGVQPPPDGLADISTKYLRGMAQQGDRLVLVLDIQELIRVTDDTDEFTAEVISA
jgi:chemotaxis signal transduction protein